MGSKVRCHILFAFRQGPWGGCNQFLTALREELINTGNWADSPATADVVLIDSFNDTSSVIRWKRQLPDVPFIHRIDGPVSIYRGRDVYIDRLIHAIGSRIADGVIFQSDYSRHANLALGMPYPRFSHVINNAAHREHFCPRDEQASSGRIRIVAVSWSSHWNKGFDVYSYLDRYLDYSRYSMKFIGNSPVIFTNIEHIPPQNPAVLGKLLRESDIYITASRHESCSNSLLEALACGLPAVAIRSGGNPEILGMGGELFSGVGDVIDRIDRVADNLEHYRKGIEKRRIEDVASAYCSFFDEVRLQVHFPRELTLWGAWMLWGRLALRRARTLRERLAQELNKRCRGGTGQHAPS